MPKEASSYAERLPYKNARDMFGEAAIKAAAGVYSDPTLGFADLAANRSLFRSCMESKGWARQ